MKKIYMFSLCLTSILVLVCGNSWAADNTGFYNFDEFRLDGTAWTDVPPAEIVTGQDYAVEIDFHYDVACFALTDLPYADSQTLTMSINGLEVFNATAPSPTSIITSEECGETQVDHAEWTVAGTLNYNELINPEGLHTAHISRMPGIFDGFQGIFSDVSRDLFITNPTTGDSGTAPVPEPATMLLLGCGLSGLLIARPRKKINL